MPGRAPAVELAADMLELLGNHRDQGLTVTEIAQALEANKPTCHTVALTLVQRGFLVREEVSKRYSLGPALTRLGALVDETRESVQAALLELRPLARALSLSCAVSLLLPNDQVMVAAKVDSPRKIHSTVRVGESFTTPTVSSYVLLAWRSPLETERAFLNWRRSAGDALLPASLEEYRARLAHVRRAGYVLGDTQADPAGLSGRGGVRILAAPVFDAAGRVPVAVSVFGLPGELDDARFPEYLENLVAAARRITDAIGGDNSCRPPLDLGRALRVSAGSY
jgi:DNA-binding IclR family transcriptional regulator